MLRQHKSEALAAAHEAALGLAKAGVLSSKTRRVFDEMCLTAVGQMTTKNKDEPGIRESSIQANLGSHDHGYGPGE